MSLNDVLSCTTQLPPLTERFSLSRVRNIRIVARHQIWLIEEKRKKILIFKTAIEADWSACGSCRYRQTNLEIIPRLLRPSAAPVDYPLAHGGNFKNTHCCHFYSIIEISLILTHPSLSTLCFGTYGPFGFSFRIRNLLLIPRLLHPSGAPRDAPVGRESHLKNSDFCRFFTI